MNENTMILISLSAILVSGFLLTRLTNVLKLPRVSGYIIAGVVIGPCVLHIIPEPVASHMSFVSDIALAFIAFGVGKFFKKEVLMKTGKEIIFITVSEALAAGVLITLSMHFLFRLSWDFSLVLGAIATATAPASTMMTINQYKAKGEFVNTLLQIVALDDVVCLLAFSVVSAVINGNATGDLSVNDILVPIIYNFLAIGLGVFCGYFLSRLLVPARSKDNRLILVIAMLLGLSAICASVNISPLLSCMVFGAVYINLTRDKKLFRQINNFTPPIMSIFFIVSGMNLDIAALSTVGAIGVSYFIIRIVGKYLGTYVSCLAVGTSREIRNYMGFALIPQAGVAIGLAFLGQRMLPPETGNFMLTIILSSSVLYEMVGPVSAKAALFLSGSIPREKIAEGMENSECSELPECAEAAGTEEEPCELTGGSDGSFFAGESECADAETEASGPDEAFEKPNEKRCAKDSDGQEPEVNVEEAEGTAVLPALREYNEGVDERDDYDVERTVKPSKKKKKKGKKQEKQEKS